MKAASNAALMIVLCLALITAPRASGEGAIAGATVQCLTPMLRFGTVAPGPPVVQEITCTVTSGSPWQLSVAPVEETAGSAASKTTDLLVPEFESADGAWTPLSQALALPVASGSQTSTAHLVVLRMRLTATAAAPAGQTERALRLFLNADPGEFSVVRYTYEIPTLLQLQSDEQSFVLTATDPTHPKTWEFEPRTYVVTANVPWIVEAALTGPPSVTGSDRRLPPETLRIAVNDGEYQEFRPGDSPLRIASGDATAGRAVPLVIHLAARTSGRDADGKYSTALEFSILKAP